MPRIAAGFQPLDTSCAVSAVDPSLLLRAPFKCEINATGTIESPLLCDLRRMSKEFV
jgi:hypothetical protein